MKADAWKRRNVLLCCGLDFVQSAVCRIYLSLVLKLSQWSSGLWFTGTGRAGSAICL